MRHIGIEAMLRNKRSAGRTKDLADAEALQQIRARAAGARNAPSSTVFTLRLYAPPLLHVARHVFVCFGPSLARDVLRSIYDCRGNNLGTRVGAGLIVSGWL